MPLSSFLHRHPRKTSTLAVESLPEWLAKARSPEYLTSVYRTLTMRELQRMSARSASIDEDTYDQEAIPRRESSTIPIPSHSSGGQSQLSLILARHYSVAIANRDENVDSNRYADIHPYDRTRLVLGNRLGTPHIEGQGRYLNANWVLERAGRKWWIATQAPLPNTAHTFLSVFLQDIEPPSSRNAPSLDARPLVTRVRTVVQLTQNVESGRRKAYAYFPDEVGKSMIVYPDGDSVNLPLKVTLVHTQAIEAAHCLQSTVSVVPVSKKSQSASIGDVLDDFYVDSTGDDDNVEELQEPIMFRHMLFASWPDHGVPSPDALENLLNFVNLVDSTNRDLSSASSRDNAGNVDLDPDPPVVVGCSAGIGRTGSFIALSSLLRHFGKLPPPHSPTPSASVPPSPLGPLPSAFADDLAAQEVDFLREQRPSMVQRAEQLRLIYQMLDGELSK